MNSAEIVGIALRIARRNRRKRGKYWVRPLASGRYLTGQFVSRYYTLRNYPDKFFSYFRMTISSFEELLTITQGSIVRRDTNMRLAIPPAERLAVTIRSLKAHERDDEQSVFPIVQGNLDPELRKQCVTELTKRQVSGFAVGGLSGGESKVEFWPTVHICTDLLPTDKPRYLMGIGFAAELVVCVALGIDMFDCVFATKTARFGCALVNTGQLNLKHKKYDLDKRPIDDTCSCSTCKTYTRSYLHHIATMEAVSSSLLSIHNVAYQLCLMSDMRQSIKEDRFPDFVKNFKRIHFEGEPIPKWIRDALAAVNIHLDADIEVQQNAKA